jgi:Ion channel
VLLLSFPALEEVTRPVLLTAVFALVLVAGVAVVDAGRRRLMAAVILGGIQVGLTIVNAGLKEPDSAVYPFTAGGALAITAILIVYCIYCVLRYVLQSRVITGDQIYAGISIYLMLGLAFGCLYYLLTVLNADCFAVNSPKLGETPDLMYFSFVTLATLGYGDITPITKVARTMAEVEALAGTLYIAVFMALLVSRRAEPNEAGT